MSGFDDLAPITERCPACWGDGFEHVGDFVDMFPNMYPEIIRPDCPLCGGAGRCAPVPVRGQLGVWNWTPEGSE